MLITIKHFKPGYILQNFSGHETFKDGEKERTIKFDLPSNPQNNEKEDFR